jgi:hypothetical protein
VNAIAAGKTPKRMLIGLPSVLVAMSSGVILSEKIPAT